MSGKNKVDSIEKDERVYKVSLMLRRKPVKYIINFIMGEWGVQRAQAYNYIKEARDEWKKYFANVKHAGVAYHVTQMRELKDAVFDRVKDDKNINTFQDLSLILDISKEEAKLLGAYPVVKTTVELEGEVQLTNAKENLIKKLTALSDKRGEDKVNK